MKTEELFEMAVKHGVCMPETASQLQFPKKTLFEWWRKRDKNGECEYRVVLADCSLPFAISKEWVFWEHAPQAQEISAILPILYRVGKSIFSIQMYKKADCDGDIFLVNRTGTKRFLHCTLKYSPTQNLHHYAEAHAKMYIKLREEALIKTKYV